MRTIIALTIFIFSTVSNAKDIYTAEGHPAWEIGRFAGWADGCDMKYGKPNNISNNAGMFINPKVKSIISGAARLDNDIFMQGYKVGKIISHNCVRNRFDYTWSDGLNSNKAIIRAFRNIQPAMYSSANY